MAHHACIDVARPCAATLELSNSSQAALLGLKLPTITSAAEGQAGKHALRLNGDPASPLNVVVDTKGSRPHIDTKPQDMLLGWIGLPFGGRSGSKMQCWEVPAGP